MSVAPQPQESILSSSAAQRLNRILASLGDSGGREASSVLVPADNSAATAESSSKEQQPAIASLLQPGHPAIENQRWQREGISGVVKYSESVVSALALASEIARASNTSQKDALGSLTSNSSPRSSQYSAPVSSGLTAASQAKTSSSVVRVRSGDVASREKSIDSSLVRYMCCFSLTYSVFL
jgi:hypothetical protein